MEINRNKLLIMLSLIAIIPIVFIIIFALFTMDDSTKKEVKVRTVERILPSAFREEFEDNDGRVVLDIRTPDEYEIGRLDGAVNIDYYSADFRDNLDKLDREKEYLLYCNSGNRSASAIKLMQEMGFTNVKELAGGIQAWIGAGQETCSDC